MAFCPIDSIFHRPGILRAKFKIEKLPANISIGTAILYSLALGPFQEGAC